MKSSVASPKFFFWVKSFDLSEQQFFVSDPTSQSKKWHDMLEVCYAYEYEVARFKQDNS